MAGRPLKQGLDYFSLDVDFFQSAKIRRIIQAQGTQSISVLISILANIYRKDGYYARWDGNMLLLVSEETGTREGVVTEVLQKALQVGFLDAGIFESYGVLTSEGIQERFFTAIERRRKIEIIKEFFLLDPADAPKNAVWKNAITMPKNRVFGENPINVDNNSINVSRNPINVGNNAQSKGKESKGKESKVEESICPINAGNNSINAGRNPINVDNNSPTTLSNAVLDAYQREIRPVCSMMELGKLSDDAERYGEAAVIKAIERAAIRGKRSIGYVEGILRRWEADGYDEEAAPQGARDNPQLSVARRAVEMLRGEEAQ